jgi:lysophospholipase L1-like esterase
MKKRFLALGDSYTIGECVPTDECWPMQLAAQLRQRSLPCETPLIIAKTGWTTDELDAAIDQAIPSGPFSFVTLLIGVNNQYRGRKAEEYRTQFRGLLSRAIDFAGGYPARVIVLSIPDWGVMPFAEGRNRNEIAAAIDSFNAVNLEETLRSGSRYVDITPLSRKAVVDSTLIAPDGLHPSAAMYADWVAMMLADVLALVADDPE